MPDVITTDEQALIEAHLKAKGATQVATGASSEPEMIFCGAKNRIVPKEPVENTFGKFKGRGRHKDPFVAKRRERLAAHVKAGGTPQEFAERENMGVDYVKNEARALGCPFPPPPNGAVPDEKIEAMEKRRVKVAMMLKEGTSRRQIAFALNVSPNTINRDFRVLQGQDAR